MFLRVLFFSLHYTNWYSPFFDSKTLGNCFLVSIEWSLNWSFKLLPVSVADYK